MFWSHVRAASFTAAFLTVTASAFGGAAAAEEPEAGDFGERCAAARAGRTGRVVCADLVALDQMLVYNRFGSYNPFGMIFALRGDVVPLDLEGAPGQADCAADEGVGRPSGAPGPELGPGAARLRDCRRPRPLTLRANVGDLLYLRVTNLLAPGPEGDPKPRDLSRDLCGKRDAAGRIRGTDDAGRAGVTPGISQGPDDLEEHGEVSCGETAEGPAAGQPPEAPDWPRTRRVDLVIEGLAPLATGPGGAEPDPACLGLDAAEPGASFECLYEVGVEGTHFFASRAAPAGGEGDGGSITHGLFGAVLAERPGTRWYRSQVSPAAFDRAWPGKAGAGEPGGPARHAREGAIDYEAKAENGQPLLNMAKPLDGLPFRESKVVEIVHPDLNAVIYCDGAAPAAQAQAPLGCAVDPAWAGGSTREPRYDAFREFSVFFHDELKTFYTRNFEELGRFGQLAGVRDGFAINYGSSGMGAMLLANRKGIGPAASCAECLYEEFFLTSWANGDPALLEWYDDDPSNVHHSYLNDPVVFRNFHAGPKETHVFHLHAHQWFAGNDPGRGAYLDSQTVGPAQGFTYNIYHGGRTTGEGGWYQGGSGNRNRTVGDSIFHCHLYPHFAQGMWELWRVHDVLEDGTRRLPDGQKEAGLSLDIRPRSEVDMKRAGSVDPAGRWLGGGKTRGTPIPALVPLPGDPLPPLPTYAGEGPGGSPAGEDHAEGGDQDGAEPAPWAGGPERLYRAQAAPPAGMPATPPPATPAQTQPAQTSPMPGYPFYIAGAAGHRPPQAPRDIARELDADGKLTDTLLSGGLGRHVVEGAERALPFELPAGVLSEEATLEDRLDTGDAATREAAERSLGVLRSQVTAKALALGDMTAHIEKARIRTLDPDGTPLEQAAQRFHADGANVLVVKPDGAALAQTDGGYETPRAPRPDAAPAEATGLFQVNGAPPKPGAPFADPCGGVRNRDGGRIGIDPLTARANETSPPPYVIDPKLIGFRRYEVSAVQLDLIVNRAGWHDPQARIDVLTERSDSFKDVAGNVGRISPAVRDDEEPFFFRALSGECIEFRHTNEMPKELALDDFQVKTPTDTVGQHIHLVKFDVTSSDGSGNGWNYEDGTFAPDELMARRCAALEGGSLTADDAAKLAAWGSRLPGAEECAELGEGLVWRKPLKGSTELADGTTIRNRDLFQTTTQRWFADPILTRDGRGEEHDRTMRTVFSHDHFGPSSIQQHGFYTALLVEPAVDTRDGQPGTRFSKLCEAEKADGQAQCGSGPVIPADTDTPTAFRVEKGDERWVGARKLVVMKPDATTGGSLHPDYREFALAVADFATLYDPRDRETLAEAVVKTEGPRPAAGSERFGMSRLQCEAAMIERGAPERIGAVCGESLATKGGFTFAAGEDVPPAWWAGGAPGDMPAHRARLGGSLMLPGEAEALANYLGDYRRKAARPALEPEATAGLAKPVAPPARPESISVDHHDPYLVNYRGAPIPLRLATKSPGQSRVEDDCAPIPMTRQGARPDRSAAALAGARSPLEARLIAGDMPPCSYRYQITGAAGDAGLALSSWDTQGMPTRDPETPVLESFQGERIMLRLVQGAQEVQHEFNVAGLSFPRDIDQPYPRGMRDLAVTSPPARTQCFEAVRKTYPEHYEEWIERGIPPSDQWRENVPVTAQERAYWEAFAEALARCDNLEGRVFAQEIGISEHFEMRGRLRADVASSPEFRTIPGARAARVTAGSGPDLGHDRMSDYLYNYGSLDSLWNGAWGFVRVYDDASAPDIVAKGAEAGTPVGDRLARISDGPGTGESLVVGEAGRREGNAACPLPREGENWNYTLAILAAIETRELRDPGKPRRGTRYGADRRDPDGLMLALLEPGLRDGNGAVLLPGMDDDEGWAHLPRAKLIEAVRRTYGARPEPFVMRVNAGDCVLLRYVNGLKNENDGLRDGLGDALAPKIAPLNLDPAPAVKRETEPGQTRVEGVLAATTAPVTGLRPSARLGLSIGLPSGELIRDLPLGYGVNRQSMAPGAADGVTVSPVFSFYAGRYVVSTDPVPGVPPDVARDIAQAASAPLGQLLGGQVNLQPATGAGDVTILGDPYDLNLTVDGQARELDDTRKAEAQDVVNIIRDSGDFTHWIPYAYGPVPVRVTGDMISHTVHGLFGTIDVVPAQWDGLPAAGTRSYDRSDALGDIAARAGLPDRFAPKPWRAATLAKGFGAPLTVRAGLAPTPGGETTRIREFVIFYQDGLNHRDESRGRLTGSKIRWSLEASGPEPVQAAVDEYLASGVDPPPLTPDCAICDDSYDFGEQGVSYRTRPFATLLRPRDIAGNGRIEASDDLNAIDFPAGFLAGASARSESETPLTLEACVGDQVVIRVLHPGGRARQHAFVMNGLGYDDLFPGFGFPNAALLGPGKSISAWLHPPTVPGPDGRRVNVTGKVMWQDGPSFLMAGGIWGLVSFVDTGPACEGAP